MIERTRDNRFEIKRVYRISNEPNQLENLKSIKNSLGYETIIKDEKNGLFLLCNEIYDAVIVSEDTFVK